MSSSSPPILRRYSCKVTVKDTYHHVNRQAELLFDHFDQQVLLNDAFLVGRPAQEHKGVQVLVAIDVVLSRGFNALQVGQHGQQRRVVNALGALLLEESLQELEMLGQHLEATGSEQHGQLEQLDLAALAFAVVVEVGLCDIDFLAREF